MARWRPAARSAPLLLLLAGTPGTTTVDVRVLEELAVGGAGRLPRTEPHLAVDPRDPDHVLVAAIEGFTRAPSSD